MGVFVFKL